MSGPDYIVDIEGLRHLNPSEGVGNDAASGSQAMPRVTPGSGVDSGAASGVTSGGRPWIAVQWKCCSTYSRIYRDRGGQHYAGTCPRCGRAVRARIGTDGTPARFFVAE